MNSTPDALAGLYRQMFLIRVLEETLLELFSAGRVFGTTHTCIGQEANAVGVIAHLNEDDIVFSNHRCHGHYLAFTDDPLGLLAEVMGRATGACGGVGGSQHLYRNNFYSNGVLGGTVPSATGIACAEKQLGRRSVTVVFLGDGTLGQGVVYESMNISALWSLPILFVIENNYYAQSTPSRLQLAGEIADRPRAFGIATTELTTTDVEEIHAAAGPIIARVREAQRPACLILNTYRLAAHSKGDDMRDPTEIEAARVREPLRLTRGRILEATALAIETDCRRTIADAVQRASQAAYPVPGPIQP